MKTPAFFLFILLLSIPTQAQINLDSLWGVRNDELAPDTSRARAMQTIAWKGYLFSQPDSAFYFAQNHYDFAKEKDLKKEMASALKTQGASYLIRGDYTQALYYFQQCLTIYEETNDKIGMAKTLNNIGLVYSNQGEYPKALDYYQRSLKIKEEISDIAKIASSLNNIGIVYINQGDYPRALGNLQKCLKIYEELSDKRNMAGVLNNIGLICLNQEDYPKALDYYQRCFKINEELSDQSGMAKALNNIGLIYRNQGSYSQAMDYYEQSLQIKEEISDKRGMARSYNNIGSVYMYQGNYQQALNYFHQSLKIREDISDKRGIAITMYNIGNVSNKQGKYHQAIRWCAESLINAQELNILEEQKDACRCLYDANKAIGNDNKALNYYERVSMLDDSLQAEETAKKLQQMEFARQIFKDSLVREKEKMEIRVEHEEEVRKKNRTRNIILVIVLFLVVIVIGIFRRVIYVRKAKKVIEIEKDRSDKLLLNILPSEIAEELKDKGNADARSFKGVSILFTDFKGFTEISENLSAERLVGEINTCFKAFDAICGKYGIEKIKTIGDAYMAAGGLPVPNDHSVKNTVLAGIEMTEFISNRKKDREEKDSISFEMRVGIHTGSVVAGIVGVTKFQYDIWGDAVNIASRMESSGEIGKVNISQSTYQLLKDDPDFKFESRGKIKTKGKGDVQMWFVSKSIEF